MSDKYQSSNYESDNKHQYARNFFEYELILNNELANGIDIINYLKKNGFDESDIRLQKLFKLLKHNDYEYKTNINLDEFLQIIIDSEQSILLNKIFSNNLIVPDFTYFSNEIKNIFDELKLENNTGNLADYIPQLSKVDPNLFGISICTIDGQRFKYGDYNEYFCIQSSVKPLLYGLALEEHSNEIIQKYIGCEPSGVNFNNLSLNKINIPHNPMINSGAIMSCALLYSNKSSYERFDLINNKLNELSGTVQWKFSNSVYLSEKETADSNFCLAYMMRKYNSFPKNTNIQNTLDLYFQTCSLEVNCDILSITGATIANNGINPLTYKTIFKKETCKDILSLMLSCGMYDYSGKWAFDIGIPAKSGVSGNIYAIIPNFGCIAIFSPLLDEIVNSVKGIKFFKKLIEKFQFHIFDTNSSNNLQNEKVMGKAYVVGNTGLDNLLKYKQDCADDNKILITIHRRENHNKINKWFDIINQLAINNPKYEFILPSHPNPNVQQHIPILTNVKVINPLPHDKLIKILIRCSLVITDSGGLQEECSFFNKRCLVCRETTERPESLNITSFLVEHPNKLEDAFNYHISQKTIDAVCPFGDGQSSKKIIEILRTIIL